MSRLFQSAFLLLSCSLGLGLTMIQHDDIQLTPANAADYRVQFSYGATNNAVGLIVPYTKGDSSFNSAVLICTNSPPHFSIPLDTIHPAFDVEHDSEDVILISFVMDRQTLRACQLEIHFRKNLRQHETVYVLSMKDFVPKKQ